MLFYVIPVQKTPKNRKETQKTETATKGLKNPPKNRKPENPSKILKIGKTIKNRKTRQEIRTTKTRTNFLKTRQYFENLVEVCQKTENPAQIHPNMCKFRKLMLTNKSGPIPKDLHINIVFFLYPCSADCSGDESAGDDG